MIEPLRGNVAHPVRVGNTVHRDAGPWTPAVHALLNHLRDHGFRGVPQPLGFDKDGREILEYIDGVDGRAIVQTDASLTSAIRLIRALHDAMIGFEPPPGSVWNTKPFMIDRSGEPANIIAHNDLATYNTIYRDGDAVAVIDWDFAAPASRLWDIAHAAWSFTPLYPTELVTRLGYQPDDTIRRLRIICDTYGVEDRPYLMHLVEERLRAAHDPTHDYLRFVAARQREWARQLG